MAIIDAVKGTVNTAVDTISEVAQTFVEKNRTKAKLNRLRLVMKSESEMMNRAYIALGKQYYEMQKKGEVSAAKNQEQLFEVIEQSKAKIAKARDCYKKIVDNQNDYIYHTFHSEEDVDNEVVNENLVDITVACSNESDYSNSPFEDITVAGSEPKEEDVVAEEVEKAEEPASETADEPDEPTDSDDTDDEAEGESPNEELF